SGIIGRLFREFAVTVALTIALSTFTALTLSPTMCAQFLRNEHAVQHGRLYNFFERVFEGLIGAYRHGLDFVLRHQRATFAVFLSMVGLSVVLYVLIPKGFFPQEDTGIIVGLSDAPQDISYTEIVKRMHQLTAIAEKDPAVQGYITFVGGSRPLNTNFFEIALKPRSERTATADQVIARLRKQFAKVPGATIDLQARQDIRVGGRTSRTQYEYTLQDINLEELYQWAPKLLAKLKTLPQLSDVTTDQQAASTMLTVDIDRDAAARFGIQPYMIDETLNDAFG